MAWTHGLPLEFEYEHYNRPREIQQIESSAHDGSHFEHLIGKLVPPGDGGPTRNGMTSSKGGSCHLVPHTVIPNHAAHM